MNLSGYGANAILDGDAMPATLWFQPHTADPGPDAEDDPAAGGTRRAFTRTAAASGQTSNAGAMSWLPITADETWTHGSAWDDETAGNPWLIGELTTPYPVQIGEFVQIPAAGLDLELDHWT